MTSFLLFPSSPSSSYLLCLNQCQAWFSKRNYITYTDSFLRINNYFILLFIQYICIYERNLIATEQQKRFIENNFTASTDGSALNFVFLLLLFWRLNILDFFFFVTSHIYELLNATKVIQNFDSSRFWRCGARAASKFKYCFSLNFVHQFHLVNHQSFFPLVLCVCLCVCF